MGYAITRKGQVTLPKPVRERLGVGPGEQVEFRLGEHGEVIIERATGEPPPEHFARWRGFFGPGPSTDEIMALTRGDDR